MVIDASKGVEAQTRKLFKVCTMRHIPIFTFINKMDREAMDTFELLDDIENELGIATCPVNWPIGSGKRFKGVYDRNEKESRVVLRHQKGYNTGNRAQDQPGRSGSGDITGRRSDGDSYWKRLSCRTEQERNLIWSW